MFIDAERTNAEAVYKGLAAFDVPVSELSVEDLQDMGVIYQIGQPPLRIDILNSLSGINFESAWLSRVDAQEEGVPVPYIGRKDLITNKVAAGRLQDLADAESIRDAAIANTKEDSGFTS